MKKVTFLLAAIIASGTAYSSEKKESIFEERPDIAKIIGKNPKDILDVRKAVQEVDTATFTPLQNLPDAKADVSEVYLTANEQIPVVYLVPGNPTTLEFTDITGATWPVLEHKTFSPFIESVGVENSAKNALWLIAQQERGEAVISVYLHGLDTVVSVKCIANGQEYHRTKTVKIMKLGHNAKVNRITVREAEEAGAPIDEELLSAAYGIRPNGSKIMKSSSDAVIAWEKGNDIYLYTSLDLMIPSPIRIKTGTANGWKAFKIQRTTRLQLTNETGNVVKVRIESNPQLNVTMVQDNE